MSVAIFFFSMSVKIVSSIFLIYDSFRNDLTSKLSSSLKRSLSIYFWPGLIWNYLPFKKFSTTSMISEWLKVGIGLYVSTSSIKFVILFFCGDEFMRSFLLNANISEFFKTDLLSNFKIFFRILFSLLFGCTVGYSSFMHSLTTSLAESSFNLITGNFKN